MSTIGVALGDLADTTAVEAALVGVLEIAVTYQNSRRVPGDAEWSPRVNAAAMVMLSIFNVMGDDLPEEIKRLALSQTMANTVADGAHCVNCAMSDLAALTQQAMPMVVSICAAQDLVAENDDTPPGTKH